MSTPNFELAVKLKVRFATSRGDASLEQLYDMPLTSRNGFDLDTTARSVYQELKSIDEVSFVSSVPNKAKDLLQLKLDLVTHVIASKLEENSKVLKAAKNKEERQKLLGILNQKQDEELSTLTADEIKARILALEEVAE